MAVVIINRPVVGGAPTAPVVGTHPKAFLADDSGLKVVLPFAPRGVDASPSGPEWTTTDRAGRKPLLLKQGDTLASLSFDAFIRLGDHQTSVESRLAQLRALYARGGRVTVGGMGPSESGTYRLTGLTQRSELRQHGTNHITEAVVTLTLTEASDVVVSVGPVTGGAKTAPAKPAPKVAGKPSTAARTYRVKAGDTLSAIALRYYGRASRWRELADANGVRDPRKLRVGTVLKVPA